MICLSARAPLFVASSHERLLFVLAPFHLFCCALFTLSISGVVKTALLIASKFSWVNISELVEYSMASKDMISLPMSSQLKSSDPFDANLFAFPCTSTETAVTGARLSEAAMAVKLTVQLRVFMPPLHY